MAPIYDVTGIFSEQTNQIAQYRSRDCLSHERRLFDMLNMTWIIPPVISMGYSTREGPSKNNGFYQLRFRSFTNVPDCLIRALPQFQDFSVCMMFLGDYSQTNRERSLSWYSHVNKKCSSSLTLSISDSR